MVVGGAPEHDDSHSERVCDMALDMVDAITDLKDPSTGNICHTIIIIRVNFSFLLRCIFKYFKYLKFLGSEIQ